MKKTKISEIVRYIDANASKTELEKISKDFKEMPFAHKRIVVIGYIGIGKMLPKLIDILIFNK